jgi:hypothetical protein
MLVELTIDELGIINNALMIWSDMVELTPSTVVWAKSVDNTSLSRLYDNDANSGV